MIYKYCKYFKGPSLKGLPSLSMIPVGMLHKLHTVVLRFMSPARMLGPKDLILKTCLLLVLQTERIPNLLQIRK